MPSNHHRNSRRDRLESWSHHFGYDLGRAARQVAYGADTLADALGRAGSLLRTLESRWSRRRSASSEPRVEVVVDPRARARGRYLPATIAVAIDHEQRVEWRSTIDSLEDLSRGALSVLQSMEAETNSPFVAVATNPVVRWQDIRELAEVSGLAGALREVRQIALRHDRDAVLAKLADALEALDSEQRKAMGFRFLERLTPDPLVKRLIVTSGFRPVDLRAGELDQLAEALASSACASLYELGLSSDDVRHVAVIAQDVASPLMELTDFYLNARTPAAKIKRYWRLQRVGLTALRIASRPSFGVEALRPSPPKSRSRSRSRARIGRRHGSLDD